MSYKTAPRGTHSSDAVCEKAKITYRQLDHWVRRGYLNASVLPAHGSGSWRRFSESDLRLACVLGRLSSVGCDHRMFPAIAHRLDIAARFGLDGEFLVVGKDDRVEIVGRDELALVVLDHGACFIAAIEEIL